MSGQGTPRLSQRESTNVTLQLPRDGHSTTGRNPFNNFDGDRNSLSSAVLNSEPLPNIQSSNGQVSQN